MGPFLILSLPRSMSTWLSVFLSQPGRVVAHDLGAECGSPEEFLSKLSAYVGTCETGAAFAAPLIRHLVPGVRFVVIKRDELEVSESLDALGLGWHLEEMAERANLLDAISDWPGVLTKTYADLATFEACDEIHQFCLGRPADPVWWEKMTHTNVQIDIPWQMSRLIQNAPAISALKQAVSGYGQM